MAVASVNAVTEVCVSSKVTLASRRSKLTSTSLTPSTRLSAVLTVIGQAEQVIPGTSSVTVCSAPQAEQLPASAAWALVRDGEGLREYEREALERYSERMGLEPTVCRALERAYPVLVAAVAERNWDYSRPRWVHRQFEL